MMADPPQREEHSPRKEGAYQDDSSSKSELDWQLGLEDFWLPTAGVFLPVLFCIPSPTKMYVSREKLTGFILSTEITLGFPALHFCARSGTVIFPEG